MKRKYGITINGYVSERYFIEARNKEKAEAEALRLFNNDLEEGKIDIEINDVQIYEDEED